VEAAAHVWHRKTEIDTGQWRSRRQSGGRLERTGCLIEPSRHGRGRRRRALILAWGRRAREKSLTPGSPGANGIAMRISPPGDPGRVAARGRGRCDAPSRPDAERARRLTAARHSRRRRCRELLSRMSRAFPGVRWGGGRRGAAGRTPRWARGLFLVAPGRHQGVVCRARRVTVKHRRGGDGGRWWRGAVSARQGKRWSAATLQAHRKAAGNCNRRAPSRAPRPGGGWGGRGGSRSHSDESRGLILHDVVKYLVGRGASLQILPGGGGEADIFPAMAAPWMGHAPHAVGAAGGR